MNELEARAIHDHLEIGRQYEIRDHPDDAEFWIVRLTGKGIFIGEECSVTIDGVWFYGARPTDPGQGSEGIPGWKGCPVHRLETMPKEYRGPRLRRQPIHEKWFCECCNARAEKPKDKDSRTFCCHDEIYTRQWAEGKHDATCMCSDCLAENFPPTPE